MEVEVVGVLVVEAWPDIVDVFVVVVGGFVEVEVVPSSVVDLLEVLASVVELVGSSVVLIEVLALVLVDDEEEVEDEVTRTHVGRGSETPFQSPVALSHVKLPDVSGVSLYPGLHSRLILAPASGRPRSLLPVLSPSTVPSVIEARAGQVMVQVQLAGAPGRLDNHSPSLHWRIVDVLPSGSTELAGQVKVTLSRCEAVD